ncbi:hypothetical protein BCR41DRAFT_365678 [Lobosporangium transversale]|uniref:Uncharacterized protein n=1 Tax=Lobosporangium transversale TaxID=64571 RepID=A0A1Y2G4Z3_9FUNG|nr:hypothetical protein BCR41DRAFT_365678 [Lobosporangium transversale]ORY93673.1 hypothetical protein BCR41DRAFT_365678 [Lobosporangium transversale]|eukprot:XP_021875168.1 hypothetical protein BCR41DRAFT_365678 [Lobosporangium transversale]
MTTTSCLYLRNGSHPSLSHSRMCTLSGAVCRFYFCHQMNLCRPIRRVQTMNT